MSGKSKRLLSFLLLSFISYIALLAAPALARPDGGAALNITLEPFIAPGQLAAPVDFAHAGDDRFFVLEREGRVRIIRPDGAVDPTPFLDISDRVHLNPPAEQGLLGIAFHPDYKQNGFFYLNYTAEPDANSHIVRYSVSADPDVADPDSELLLFSVPQPHGLHYGGDLLFGPDGYLYIGFGDGIGGNDIQNRVQNLQTPYGKLLRIDVDGGGDPPDCGSTAWKPAPYTIPAGNPFADGPGGNCDEIWALGLRNPWRLSFDRHSGDLYIGDVGESAWEEVNVQPAASPGGENYGWPCYEGAHYNDDNHMPACEDAAAYQMPVVEYSHADGNCSITGGYVYRGLRFPEMSGRYILSDFCAPYIWDLNNDGGVWQSTRHDDAQVVPGGVATLGEDFYGELFVASMYDGAVYRIAEDTLITDANAGAYLPALFK